MQREKEKLSKPGVELWSLCQIFEYNTTNYCPGLLEITSLCYIWTYYGGDYQDYSLLRRDAV